ncbi:hypothetical protein OPV22_011559 [Ensete ventricosum]|uniref:Secreted protein n=1 Tax=Ensete ventricosum TaxID=4639 RepID=A0AAV8RI64_ENSVE|nr:hypothetical protein OPV22_011559 [Ensete ventricosum]
MAWVGCCLQLAFLFWALPVLIQSGRRKEFPRVFACFHTGICVGGRATRSARLCTSLPIHPSSRSQPRFDLGALHKILRIPTRTPTVFLPTLVVRITSMQVLGILQLIYCSSCGSYASMATSDLPTESQQHRLKVAQKAYHSFLGRSIGLDHHKERKQKDHLRLCCGKASSGIRLDASISSWIELVLLAIMRRGAVE